MMRGVEEAFNERYRILIGEQRAKGLTCKEIAEKMGVSLPTFFAYRRGTYLPSVFILHGMCKAFGCSADWLLGLSDDR